MTIATLLNPSPKPCQATSGTSRQRIQYNKKDYKATVKVPVKWAGDTPVLMLQNYLIQGQGVFSARILIHNGMYAGTWGNQKQGGKMFGKVVKNEPLPAQPPTPQPNLTGRHNDDPRRRDQHSRSAPSLPRL